MQLRTCSKMCVVGSTCGKVCVVGWMDGWVGGRLAGWIGGWMARNAPRMTDMPHEVMGEGAAQVPRKGCLHTRIEVHAAQKMQFGMVSR